MTEYNLCVQIGPDHQVALNEHGQLICLAHFVLDTEDGLSFKYIKDDNPYSFPPTDLNNNAVYPLRIYARQTAIKETLYTTFNSRPFGYLKHVHIEWDSNPSEKRTLHFVFVQQPHPELLDGLVALGAEVEVLGEA